MWLFLGWKGIIFWPFFTFWLFPTIFGYFWKTTSGYSENIMTGYFTVLLPRCSMWQARRISFPKTPVTLGERSGLIKGWGFWPFEVSSIVSWFAKAAIMNRGNREKWMTAFVYYNAGQSRPQGHPLKIKPIIDCTSAYCVHDISVGHSEYSGARWSSMVNWSFLEYPGVPWSPLEHP